MTETRTCPDCHNQMHLYANRCGHCTSFSEPPARPESPGPLAWLISILIMPFAIYFAFKMVWWIMQFFWWALTAWI